MQRSSVVSTNPFEKHARRIGFISPGVGMKMKNLWNHHLAPSFYGVKTKNSYTVFEAIFFGGFLTPG